MYDPFERGEFGAGVRTLHARDSQRDRAFRCDVWYPAARDGRDAAETQGVFPLVVYSHHSGGNREAATYLFSHLSSRGYVVAAIDHSEIADPDLPRERWIENRVPDLRFVIDRMLDAGFWDAAARVDAGRIGAVGHSFGGWAVLALAEVDDRIASIVALAPAGSSNPRPGILPATLTFAWRRAVPVLYVAAQADVSLPLAGIYELYRRTQSPKRLAILENADHLHFIDDAERHHEAVRVMEFPPVLAWLGREMRPFSELSAEADAHRFVRGLAAAHLDATLKDDAAARTFEDEKTVRP